MVPTWEEESRLLRLGVSRPAGIDEAGRGAWAGPLVAAAVILPPASPGLIKHLADVRDSKAVSPKERERLLGKVRDVACAIGVGGVTAHEIDLLGLSAAGQLAMRRAVRQLGLCPEYLLVDGFPLWSMPYPQKPIIFGDSVCLSIAAASIVAKVTRDQMMVELDAAFPQYGFAVHKGYGTPRHRAALERHGPCMEHRTSYGPVRMLARHSGAGGMAGP